MLFKKVHGLFSEPSQWLEDIVLLSSKVIGSELKANILGRWWNDRLNRQCEEKNI